MFWEIKMFWNKGGAKILYFEKKLEAQGWHDHKNTILSWPTILFFKLHSCKHNLHNIQGKHARDSSKSD
jgi:hypothetical protein